MKVDFYSANEQNAPTVKHYLFSKELSQVMNGEYIEEAGQHYQVISEFKLNQLKPAAAMLDTGYSLEETKSIIRTMYNKKVPNVETQPFAYIILRKVKVEHKQNTLEL